MAREEKILFLDFSGLPRGQGSAGSLGYQGFKAINIKYLKEVWLHFVDGCPPNYDGDYTYSYCVDLASERVWYFSGSGDPEVVNINDLGDLYRQVPEPRGEHSVLLAPQQILEGIVRNGGHVPLNDHFWFENLQVLAQRFRNGADLRQDPDFQNVVRHLTQFGHFDTLYLCAHGRLRDTQYLYSDVGAEEHEQLLEVNQLANFISTLLAQGHLPDRLNIQFIVCYGARTQENIDHIFDEREDFFRATLAGRFLERVVQVVPPRTRINFIAYTGAVSFDEYSGELYGQTEAQVFASSIREIVSRVRGGVMDQIALLENRPPSVPNAPEECARCWEDYERMSRQIDILDAFLSRHVIEYGLVFFHNEEGVINIDLSMRGQSLEPDQAPIVFPRESLLGYRVIEPQVIEQQRQERRGCSLM